MAIPPQKQLVQDQWNSGFRFSSFVGEIANRFHHVRSARVRCGISRFVLAILGSK
jgi:hypothetical protein